VVRLWPGWVYWILLVVSAICTFGVVYVDVRFGSQWNSLPVAQVPVTYWLIFIGGILALSLFLLSSCLTSGPTNKVYTVFMSLAAIWLVRAFMNVANQGWNGDTVKDFAGVLAWTIVYILLTLDTRRSKSAERFTIPRSS